MIGDIEWHFEVRFMAIWREDFPWKYGDQNIPCLISICRAMYIEGRRMTTYIWISNIEIFELDHNKSS